MKTVGVQGHEQIGDVFKKGEGIALIGPYGGGKSMILQKWMFFTDRQISIVKDDAVLPNGPRQLELFGIRDSES